MTERSRRTLALAALIVAGEAAFLLPFVVARVFRPTLLDVFGLTNLELGTAFAVYGVVAMVAYALGGPLADRFSPRIMLAIALAFTAAGGLVLMANPSLPALVALYAYWGVTTIALFWSPLIRATREWGDDDAQGRAFGLLDGGRGLLAAVMALIAVTVFAAALPADSEAASLAQRAEALRQVILLFFAMTCGAAVLVWLALPGGGPTQQSWQPQLTWSGIARVLAMRSVWIQAAIILCAYVGFKATDDFSLYAHEILDLNDVEAARIGVVTFWVRPVAAVGAGYLADRVGAVPMTIGAFVMMAAGSLVMATGVIGAGMIWALVLTIVCSSMGVYALRGLYFAIMQDGKVPMAYTGSAVGFVSMIGYTPDVFMGPLMGYLLDSAPGIAGQQHVFWVVSGFALAGLVASVLFWRVSRQPQP